MQFGLKLSKEQENEMLTARRRMLGKLNTLVENRRAIISQLGMELLQTARVRAPAIQTALTSRTYCRAAMDPADQKKHVEPQPASTLELIRADRASATAVQQPLCSKDLLPDRMHSCTGLRTNSLPH